jgi:membrane protease YdiL (CAAX protease family)
MALCVLALLLGLPIAFEALAKGPLGCSDSLTYAGLFDLLLAVAIAPVIEELALRAGLQDGVRAALGGRDRSGWIEVEIATLAFVALHWARSPWPLPLAWALPGLALAGLYVWRRSLIQSIAVHAAFNLAALAVCTA